MVTNTSSDRYARTTSGCNSTSTDTTVLAVEHWSAVVHQDVRGLEIKILLLCKQLDNIGFDYVFYGTVE